MAASASGDPLPKLPYRLEALVWDAQHHFNQQNRYGYNGKPWKKYSDPMLMCEMCDQWFAQYEVSCIPGDAQFVPFQRNYRFVCRVCGAGQEQFEFLTNTWSSIAMTAMYNLLLTDDQASFVKKEKWLKVADVVAWVRAHWGPLCMGRDLAQLEENKSLNKCLYHMADPAKEGSMVQLSADRAEVKVSHIDSARLLIKPLNATTIPKELLGQALSAKEGKEGKTGREKDASANKRKRGAAAKKEKDKEKDRPAPSYPDMQDIKLPDKYRLLPVPKNDAAHAQPDDVVQLSRTAKAPQISLKDDLLTAVGYKGYRMVRATHGVASGSWYFEIKVNTPHNGEDGHTRLGWCTEMGELQAPVGYDENSYSYRDRVALPNGGIAATGSRFHASTGVEYGGAYGPGDTIGCWLQMGVPAASVRSRQRINIKGVEYIVEEERERTPSVGSQISFFKNGESQGTAFEDVWAEVYYPAASLFKAAAVTFNFGPTFAFPPDCDARPVCELASPGASVSAPSAAPASSAIASAPPVAAPAPAPESTAPAGTVDGPPAAQLMEVDEPGAATAQREDTAARPCP